jgi:hypothetical protein
MQGGRKGEEEWTPPPASSLQPEDLSRTRGRAMPGEGARTGSGTGES